MFYFTNQEEIFLFLFLLSIFTFRSLKLHAILRFYSGIICGPIWGSFVVLGSFAVQSGDHLRFRDQLRRCTVFELGVCLQIWSVVWNSECTCGPPYSFTSLSEEIQNTNNIIKDLHS